MGEDVGACCCGGYGCEDPGGVCGFGGAGMGVGGVKAWAEKEAAEGGGMEGAERSGGVGVGEPEEAIWCSVRHLWGC